ncbi:hypothetical protein RRG08_045135 [Elysia crispata]|uniref:ER membrane protein complex subunit 10 n=1 Tax=Elysia crispata TaxID=231223 RepID=A0AAE0YSV4_9GAST|nr:hypothetical protein RRG08_045135 [Elysia crispata]
MSSSISWLICLNCVFTAGVVLDDEFEGSRTLSLEHSFSSGKSEFTRRGTVVIQSLKGNKAQFTPASSLSEEEIDSLKELAKHDGLYRVRIPLKDGSGDIPAFVSSATRACAIVESGLHDEITVNFDQSGEVLGVSIRAIVPACSGVDVPYANLTAWKTSVEVYTTVSGPTPDTQTYIEKMKRDEQEKIKNQDGDNRSFLAKYLQRGTSCLLAVTTVQQLQRGTSCLLAVTTVQQLQRGTSCLLAVTTVQQLQRGTSCLLAVTTVQQLQRGTSCLLAVTTVQQLQRGTSCLLAVTTVQQLQRGTSCLLAVTTVQQLSVDQSLATPRVGLC